MTKPTDIGVVVGGWGGWLFVQQLLKKKIKPKVFQLSALGTNALVDIPVFIGNGDPLSRVEKTFGRETALSLWDFSEKNYVFGKELLTDLQVPFEEKGLLRNDLKEKENAYSFSASVLEERVLRLMSASGCPAPLHIKSPKISSKNQLEVFLEWEGGSEALSSLVWISEAPTPLASLKEKVIPVTLTLLSASQRELPFSICLFNKGADFLYGGTKTWMGSYRNLYEDKAAGILSSADPKTIEGVKSFFTSLGTLAKDESLETHLCVEAITCDGLPVIGALPEMPSVTAVSGFAAHTGNYLFSASHIWVADFLSGGSYDRLGLFSTKRFV
jgi:hypothetical protein